MTEEEMLRAQVAELKEKLNRCFRGETHAVRNEIILAELNRQTKELLALPQDELLRRLTGEKTE